MTNIVVPELGESVVEARVLRWMRQVGDRVSVGDPLVELETEKVNLEVAAEKAGVLTAIAHQEGDDVKIGEVLGQIADAATAPVAAAPSEPSEPLAPVAPPSPVAATPPAPVPESVPAAARPALARAPLSSAPRPAAAPSTPASSSGIAWSCAWSEPTSCGMRSVRAAISAAWFETCLSSHATVIRIFLGVAPGSGGEFAPVM